MAKHGVTEFLQWVDDVSRQFVELETDFLIVLDRDGKIIDVNPAFEELMNCCKTDVIGTPMSRIVLMNDWAIFFRSFTDTHYPTFRLLRRGSGYVRVKNIKFAPRGEQYGGEGLLILRPIQ